MRSTPEHSEVVSRRLAAVGTQSGAGHSRPGGTGSGAMPAPSGDGTPWEPTRIRPREADDSIWVESGHSSDPVPVPVPRAGRHLRSRVPVGLRGRVNLTPAHLAVLSLLIAGALALASWWMLRSSPEVIDASTPQAPLVTPATAPDAQVSGLSSGAAGSQPPGEAPAATAVGSAPEVVVDVAGKVRRPGIAVLPSGARVVDALEAAGGARRGVDLATLNLARPLVDGEQILVGTAPVPGQVASAVAGAPAPAAGALISLNSADQVTLETLPGVGPVTAQAIIGWREENGGFTAVEDLLDVDGIGDATLADLAPLVTL